MSDVLQDIFCALAEQNPKTTGYAKGAGHHADIVVPCALQARQFT